MLLLLLRAVFVSAVLAVLVLPVLGVKVVMIEWSNKWMNQEIYRSIDLSWFL